MKFGVEFASRSISRWRNYNIDYNLLKSIIREATSEFEDISSSDNSSDTLTDHQKKILKKLYQNFKDQIDFVSLFVFSKVGEISRRLSSLKKQCNLFIQSEATFKSTNIENESSVSTRLRKRKLLLFHKELDSITTELQDLSRFILLQKIAVKKLLKKFVKHSCYSQKQAFVNKITTRFLVENPKSFIHLSLDDLALETTLLYDFLDTFLSSTLSSNNQSKGHLPLIKKNRHSSIHTIDSLQLVTQSYTPNLGYSSENNENSSQQLFSRSTTFDIVSRRKGPRSLTFWIHKDNLDEIKFVLSSEFKLITDESLFTKDVKLKSTRSSLNLQDDAKRSNKDINNSTASKAENTNNNEEFCPETDTVSIWLNNPKTPFFLQTAPIENFDYDISSIDNLNTFKASPYSQILVSNIANSTISNENHSNNPILLTPIGGLRQFSIASLNKKMVDLLFNNKNEKMTDEERKKILFEEWENSNDLKGNKQMMQLSFDWVLENKVKPLARVSSKKLRYINLDSNDKINFYISLEWDIQIYKTNDDGTENSEVTLFPHAILEINFDVPESEFPSNIQSLINSHLVYRVDNYNFSLNNYLISLYLKDHDSIKVSDDEILLFIATWHNLLTDKDIRILPEMRAKSLPFNNMNDSTLDNDNIEDEHHADEDANEGILLNNNEPIASKPGYWNEFDNGSDYGGDDGGFYVYNDGEDSNNVGLIDWFINMIMGKQDSSDQYAYDIESNYGAGLDWLSEEKTNRILNWANKTRNFGLILKRKILGEDYVHPERKPLLHGRTDRGYSFGAIEDAYNADEEDEDEESDMETEAMMRLSNKKRFAPLTVLARENHDKCLSFLYMIMIIFSLFTSSIGTLILRTVFGDTSTQLPKPQITAGLLILVIFAIACLLLSILLTGFSICLLLCRYVPAPAWHLWIVWIGTGLATIFFFFGVLTCL